MFNREFLKTNAADRHDQIRAELSAVSVEQLTDEDALKEFVDNNINNKIGAKNETDVSIFESVGVELQEATFKLVNRVRGGKVQRRKKVSAKPGYKMQGGKVVRIKSSERRKRHMAAIKAARKRKSKKSQINRKRKISLAKRKRLFGS